MITDGEERCICQQSQTPKPNSLAQNDEHHADVLWIAHAAIQTSDHQSTWRIVGSGRAVTALNEIDKASQDNGASRDEKNEPQQAHVSKVELLSQVSDEEKGDQPELDPWHQQSKKECSHPQHTIQFR